MSKLREEFLDLRPSIAKSQRPFKFHFYSFSGNFTYPDRFWTKEEKKRFRKCKHIIVLFEEFVKQLTQREYFEQVVTFTHHLVRLMNDSSFPISLLTWMQPPMYASNCLDRFLPKTTDHPCNDVLRYLFDSNEPVLPPQVKFLDNTDITSPLFENVHDDSIANAALRVFPLVGQQVATWRKAGQVGKIDGLHRQGQVKPNFELNPYEAWGRSV